MFDLVDAIKVQSNDTKNEVKYDSILFYKSKECRGFIEEACKFEGLTVPKSIAISEKNIQTNTRDSKASLIILDLTSSESIPEEVERIGNVIPINTDVVVIGKEDSYQTSRQLKLKGFHYILWPFPREEFIEIYQQLGLDTGPKTVIATSRKAKTISVIGAKGGVGSSFISSQLARSLSEQHSSSCIISDNNFLGGDVDIFMGLESFEKAKLNSSDMMNDIDSTYAMSMVKKVNELLSILSIQSDILPDSDMSEILNTLIYSLSDQYNFVIRDFSSSIKSMTNIEYVEKSSDVIIIVTDRSVSCIRETKKIINALDERQSLSRRMIVLNNTRPEKSANASMQEVNSFLGTSPDIVCGYDSKLSQEILIGRKFSEQKFAINREIEKLALLVLGKSLKGSKKSFVKKWINKGA
ncbi:hypothetical protein M9194_18135 [Vibrio sp. S4M6]|uniref:AAA family ATPase n=1 Tax=Vibrio sinus TaxID=2946865 RepID=UPI002029EA16|nr:hypothetical protein [Vibrio sinus]MCL9783351.1 hypothetical protein [Vibrio sinus]